MTEKTSKEAASAAARVLRDPNASKDAKSAAGSALTQRETERAEFRAVVESLPGVEQERADFEAWCETRSLETGRDLQGDYISLETSLSWDGYQAGRAALQSQDREDAERYRWLRQQHWNDSELCVVANPKRAVMPGFDCPSLDRLDAAIDHARRIEGDGNDI